MMGYQYKRVFPREMPIYLKSVKSFIPNTWICLQTEYHIPNFLLQVKDIQKRKKLHRINKVIKRKQNKKKQENKQIANLHTYMTILTNIKLDYSSANSIYYCT